MSSIKTQSGRQPLGPRFTALFAATAGSNLADGILLVAVPLIAMGLTTSPLQISMLTAATWLPWLLLGLYAGARIDRGDRRRILILSVAVRVVVLAGGTGLALAGALTMPALLGLLLVYGTTEVFADTAEGTLIPAVTPRSRLGAANGRLLGVQQVTNQFVGAPLGGLLAALGATWVFGVPGLLSAVVVGIVALGLPGRYRAGDHRGGQPTGAAEHATDQAPPSRESLTHQVGAGLRFLFGHRVLRPLVITASAMNLANSAYFAVFVLWLVGPGSAVGLTGAQYGLLTTTLALGAVLGSVAAEHLLKWVAETRLLAIAYLVNSSLLLVPVLVPSGWVIGAAFALVGFTNVVGNVITRSMRQRLIPDRLLGRVSGASATLGYGGMPLGALLGGLVGEAFGLPAVFVGAVAMCLVFTAYTIHHVRPAAVAAADAQARAEELAEQPGPTARTA